MTPDPKRFAKDLLAWYQTQGRDLPWRVRDGSTPDPYKVWLSEIMLQQTTVATVKGYYQAFLSRWPTVQDLAQASVDDVLNAWQGLGYYSRARHLHACAQRIIEDFEGRFPRGEEALKKLPGIGDYTAAAISAIAYNRQATVVDGNVDRVITRLYALQEPIADNKPLIRQHAETLTPQKQPGDYAQAMMDLGATLCTPTGPMCFLCPVRGHCAACANGQADVLPRKKAKPPKPVRTTFAFWIRRPNGSILIGKRPESGLLARMDEVPSSLWQTETADTYESALDQAPLQGSAQLVPGELRHTFTHFHLDIQVIAIQVGESVAKGQAFVDAKRHAQALGGNLRWVEPQALAEQTFPTLMKKIIRHAQRYTR